PGSPHSSPRTRKMRHPLSSIRILNPQDIRSWVIMREPSNVSFPGWEDRAVLMLIRLGYDIQFEIPTAVAMVGMLHVHPSRVADLREPDEVSISPEMKVESYFDSYGNRCARWLAPAGPLRLNGSTLIEDPGTPDEGDPDAQEHPVNELPSE